MIYKKLLLIVLVGLFLCGCSSDIKKGCTSEEFVKILETKGYTVIKDEQILELDTSGQMKEDVDSIHTATRDGNYEELYVFYDLTDEKTAKEIFDGTSVLKEEMEIAYGKLNLVSESKDNYELAVLSNEKFYSYTCRIDDKVLMAIGGGEDKTNIDKNTKELGY